MPAKINTKLWNLQDMLRALGFEPEDHMNTTYREDWYIRPVDGGAVLSDQIRVVVHPDDDNTLDVYVLDRHFVTQWDAHFSGGTPHSIIRAALKAAINA